MIDSNCRCLKESDPWVVLKLNLQGYVAYPQCPNMFQCVAPFSGYDPEITDFKCHYPPGRRLMIQASDANIGKISRTSWGETAGVYPSLYNQYHPEKWDDENKIQELLKARAGIHFVGENRNPKVQKNFPNLKKAHEKIAAAYHLTDNFPPVDPEIKNNPRVRWFFLGVTPTDRHPEINNTQKIVKVYGPFYNVGGGDVKTPTLYILFYEAID